MLTGDNLTQLSEFLGVSRDELLSRFQSRNRESFGIKIVELCIMTEITIIT